MCRSTAAPLMAMAGMAGTAVGVAIAVLKEKADRRSIEREAKAEIAESEGKVTADDTSAGSSTVADDSGVDDDKH